MKNQLWLFLCISIFLVFCSGSEGSSKEGKKNTGEEESKALLKEAEEILVKAKPGQMKCLVDGEPFSSSWETYKHRGEEWKYGFECFNSETRKGVYVWIRDSVRNIRPPFAIEIPMGNKERLPAQLCYDVDSHVYWFAADKSKIIVTEWDMNKQVISFVFKGTVTDEEGGEKHTIEGHANQILYTAEGGY